MSDQIEDYLPIGYHLLPQVFQDFLYSWNKEITDATGWWNGPPRNLYKYSYPDIWAARLAENKRLVALYPSELALLKKYQAEYLEDSSTENLPPLPPLPPSPVTQPMVQPMAQPMAQPIAELRQTKPRNPYYNHYPWASPLPKVFVQKLRDNKWEYQDGRRVTWPTDFKNLWLLAGNTELKLTHENCLRYLAYRSGGISIEQFLEKNPRDVNKQFFSEFTGIKGYYTSRYYY